MSHKKNQGDKEAFYQARLRKQPHLDGGARPIIDTNEIKNALGSLDPKQIVCLATLLFNSYEDQHRHIWFSKGIREKTIDDLLTLIQALDDGIFETDDLPAIYTGLGVDDHRRKYL